LNCIRQNQHSSWVASFDKIVGIKCHGFVDW
jgi:hypothetical protein